MAAKGKRNDIVEVPNGPGIFVTRAHAELHGMAYREVKRPKRMANKRVSKHVSAAVDQIIAAFTQDYEEARATDPDLDDRIERDMEKMRRQENKPNTRKP